MSRDQDNSIFDKEEIMNKKIISVAIPLALLAVLCAGFAAEATSTPKVFKLGELQPLTGYAATWGLTFHRGFEIAIDDLNSAGGIKVGNEKYRIELISYDTKAKPSEAKAAAERLIFKDGVKFILGPCVSPTTLAVQTVTEPNKVLIFDSAAAKEATGADKPYSFMPYFSVPARTDAVIKYIRKVHPEAKRFAIMNPDVESGRTDYEVEKHFLNVYGFEEVSSQFYPMDTKDFYPILSRLLAQKPDVISLGNSFGSPTILKQLGELGYTGVKMISIPTKAELIYKTAGTASDGLYISDEDYSSGGKFVTPEKRRFYETFIKKYGKGAWMSMARAGYALVQIVSQAIEGAGTFDTDKVSHYLETHDNHIHSLYRTWKVGPPGNRMAYHPIPIARSEKGKFITIAILPNPVPGKGK
jgi:branched-chain amino acid transport system substrate-binding protein